MEQTRIHIFEHTTECCANLVVSLNKLGYRVKLASLPTNESPQLAASDSDAIIINLPYLDTTTMTHIESIRSASSSIMYVLTPSAPPSVIVQALELGVDDIQLKPIHIPSFTLRIRNALSRHRHASSLEPKRLLSAPNSMQLWQLNEDERTAIPPNGREMELTKGEFVILSTLFQAEGKVVVRERLIGQSRRSMPSSSPESITTLIYRLRKKLRLADAPCVIRTISGDGYRIVSR
jgi:DNA-binding response OmpR family regulator